MKTLGQSQLSPNLPDGPKIHLGVPGVASLEIPIRSGGLARLRRRFFPRWHEKVHAAGAQAFLHVHERDHGSLDMYVTLANFGQQVAHVENVHVEWLAIGNSGIDELSALLPTRTELPPGALSRVLVRLNLGAPSIRRLCGALKRAPQEMSSPPASITVRGRFELSRDGRRVVIDFVVENITPNVSMSSAVCQ